MSGGLSHKIIAYLGRTPNFLNEVILADGKIETWKATDKVKPTMDQLNALQSEADKIENNNQAVSNRQKEYGTVEKQIEFITEKGLEAWKTNVQAIKTKYPKE